MAHCWQEGESELEEVERELGGGGTARTGNSSPKNGSKAGLSGADKGQWAGGLWRALPPALLEAFALNFLAEWGDRSQAWAHTLAAASCSLS